MYRTALCVWTECTGEYRQMAKMERDTPFRVGTVCHTVLNFTRIKINIQFYTFHFTVLMYIRFKKTDLFSTLVTRVRKIQGCELRWGIAPQLTSVTQNDAGMSGVTDDVRQAHQTKRYCKLTKICVHRIMISIAMGDVTATAAHWFRFDSHTGRC